MSSWRRLACRVSAKAEPGARRSLGWLPFALGLSMIARTRSMYPDGARCPGPWCRFSDLPCAPIRRPIRHRGPPLGRSAPPEAQSGTGKGAPTGGASPARARHMTPPAESPSAGDLFLPFSKPTPQGPTSLLSTGNARTRLASPFSRGVPCSSYDWEHNWERQKTDSTVFIDKCSLCSLIFLSTSLI